MNTQTSIHVHRKCKHLTWAIRCLRFPCICIDFCIFAHIHVDLYTICALFCHYLATICLRFVNFVYYLSTIVHYGVHYLLTSVHYLSTICPPLLSTICLLFGHYVSTICPLSLSTISNSYTEHNIP